MLLPNLKCLSAAAPSHMIESCSAVFVWSEACQSTDFAFCCFLVSSHLYALLQPAMLLVLTSCMSADFSCHLFGGCRGLYSISCCCSRHLLLCCCGLKGPAVAGVVRVRWMPRCAVGPGVVHLKITENMNIFQFFYLSVAGPCLQEP